MGQQVLPSYFAYSDFWQTCNIVDLFFCNFFQIFFLILLNLPFLANFYKPTRMSGTTTFDKLANLQLIVLIFFGNIFSLIFLQHIFLIVFGSIFATLLFVILCNLLFANLVDLFFWYFFTNIFWQIRQIYFLSIL